MTSPHLIHSTLSQYQRPIDTVNYLWQRTIMSRRRLPLSVDTSLANRNSVGRASDPGSSSNLSSCGSRCEEPIKRTFRPANHEANEADIRLFKGTDPHIKALERLYLQAYYGPDSPKQLTDPTSPIPTSNEKSRARPTSAATPENSPGFGGSAKSTRPTIALRKPTPDQVLVLDDSGSTSCNDIATTIATLDSISQGNTPSKQADVSSLQVDAEDSFGKRVATTNTEAPTLIHKKLSKTLSPTAHPLQSLSPTLAQSISSKSTNSDQMLRLRPKSTRSVSSRSAPGNLMSTSPDESPTKSLGSSPNSSTSSTSQVTEKGSPSDEASQRHSMRHEPYAVQKVVLYSSTSRHLC